MKTSRLEIDLTNYHTVDSKGTSKGNQPKYTNGHLWVKLNFRGYEDLAEYYASRLLACSNYKDFVTYELCSCNNQNGCYSENMLKSGEVLHTLGRLLQLDGINQQDIARIDSVEKRVDIVTNSIYKLTNLDITDYLSVLLTFDAIILNEDRHLFNIALVLDTNTNTYRPAPIFDNGLSLLSDLVNYPLEELTMKHLKHVKAKPFCPNFKKQLSVLKKSSIRFDIKKVNSLLEELGENSRIRSVLEYAMYTYPDYFTDFDEPPAVKGWNNK